MIEKANQSFQKVDNEKTIRLIAYHFHSNYVFCPVYRFSDIAKYFPRRIVWDDPIGNSSDVLASDRKLQPLGIT